MMAAPGCAVCREARWVCEVHPERPWGSVDGCRCGAPGMPCELFRKLELSKSATSASKGGHGAERPALDWDVMTVTYRDSGTTGTQITVFSGSLAIAILWKHKPLVSEGQDWRWT